MNILFWLQGANIESLWTAVRIRRLIPDAELVHIGARTTLSGDVIVRRFCSRGVSRARVEIGADCEIKDDAVIQMGCIVSRGVTLLPRTVVGAYTNLTESSTWAGHPAACVADAAADRADTTAESLLPLTIVNYESQNSSLAANINRLLENLFPLIFVSVLQRFQCG